MTEINKNYKCSICGNLVKVLEAGIGELVCCGQPMNIVTEEVGVEQKPMEEKPPVAESIPSVPETPTEETTTEEPSQEEPEPQI